MMKKILIVLLIFVAAIIAFRVYRTPNSITLQNPSPTPVTTFTLVVLKDTVSVKSADDTEFQTVSGQLEIQQGDEIKTSSGGRATFLYPNGTITTIEADTHIKAESLDRDGNRSRLTLLVGSLWSKVKNVLGAGDYYEIETENTVASVRGTIFNTEFRNRITKVQGVESKIRVAARDPVKKVVIEGTAVDITSGEKVSVSSDAIPPPRRALTKQALSDDDFRRPAVKRQILEQVEREDIEDDEKTRDREREFIRKVRDRNSDDREFIQKLREKRLIDDEDDKSTPTRTPTPSPARSPLTSPTVSPILRVSPTPSPTPAPTSTPLPLTIKPALQSVSPKTATRGNTIAINGEGFLASRNIPQVTGALLGTRNIPFAIVDGLTIFADIPADMTPGTYDVKITTVTGEVLLLPQALIVQ